jgi:hypothetical protein
MFRNRSLAALGVAELISATGSQMTFLALPWFVLATTGSATRMSVVLAVELLPVAVFGIPSGSVVSRLGSRRTMVASDLVRAPVVALVPVLHWAGGLSFGVLLALVIVFGPLLGGVLISWLGASSVLLVDAGSFLAACAIVLGAVRAGARVEAADDERGVLAGVRYLARDRLLGPMTLTVILLDATGNALFTSLPLLAFVRFHRDAHVAGDSSRPSERVRSPARSSPCTSRTASGRLG